MALRDQSSARRLGYIPALDGVRAVAVLGVMAAHSGIQALGNAGIGVFIFFTLSGFLITSLLIQEYQATDSVNLAAFYARRALRLLPALAVFLAVTVIYTLLFGRDPQRSHTLHTVPASLFYYANWQWFFNGIDSMGALAHTWSLSVEEQFYLLWPALLLLLLRLRWRLMVAILVAVSSVVMVGRIATYQSASDYQRLIGTHLLADQLLFGCALAVIIAMASEPFRARVASACKIGFYPAVAFLAFAALAVSLTSKWYSTVGWTLTAICSCIVIGWVVLAPGGLPIRLLRSAPLVYLGRISYGIYLWHFLLFTHIHGRPVVAVAAFVGSIGIASLSFWLIERPALRLKPRFTPTGNAALARSDGRA